MSSRTQSLWGAPDEGALRQLRPSARSDVEGKARHDRDLQGAGRWSGLRPDTQSRRRSYGPWRREPEFDFPSVSWARTSPPRSPKTARCAPFRPHLIACLVKKGEGAPAPYQRLLRLGSNRRVFGSGKRSERIRDYPREYPASSPRYVPGYVPREPLRVAPEPKLSDANVKKIRRRVRAGARTSDLAAE